MELPSSEELRSRAHQHERKREAQEQRQREEETQRAGARERQRRTAFSLVDDFLTRARELNIALQHFSIPPEKPEESVLGVTAERYERVAWVEAYPLMAFVDGYHFHMYQYTLLVATQGLRYCVRETVWKDWAKLRSRTRRAPHLGNRALWL
jgi:hypothetical protein